MNNESDCVPTYKVTLKNKKKTRNNKLYTFIKVMTKTAWKQPRMIFFLFSRSHFRFKLHLLIYLLKWHFGERSALFCVFTDAIWRFLTVIFHSHIWLSFYSTSDVHNKLWRYLMVIVKRVINIICLIMLQIFFVA